MSTRYQDYVIKDGRLVGDFEAMYRHASNVPWHQDRTAFEVVAEIDLAILRDADRRQPWRRILEIGCGLGYFTGRLAATFPSARVRGADISSTAIAAAQASHPGVEFSVLDVRQPLPSPEQPFDLVVLKDLLWYVLPQLPQVMANLRHLADGGCVFVSQSIPNLPDFYGREMFPTPAAVLQYFENAFTLRYASTTDERRTERASGVYDVDLYARFLGSLPRSTE